MTRQDIMKKASLNAVTLRILLSTSLILIIIISGVGFSYAHQVLSKYAQEIAHKKVDAVSSNSTISSLQKVERTLKDNQEVITKVEKLRADGSFPEFMIVDQIKAIAKRNNIKISNFSFTTAANTETASGTQAPSTATPAPQTTTPTAQSGGNTISLTITFGSIPTYRDYLQFLYDIEQNVPKMRIKGAGISGTASSTANPNDTPQSSSTQTQGGNNIGADPLTIEMYIK